MDRPTREQVDRALDAVRPKDGYGKYYRNGNARILADEVVALRAELDTYRVEPPRSALRGAEATDGELRDWLDALKSRSTDPEILQVQRGLLDLLKRAGWQSDEVQALVKAAREVLDRDPPEPLTALIKLEDALKPFEGRG